MLEKLKSIVAGAAASDGGWATMMDRLPSCPVARNEGLNAHHCVDGDFAGLVAATRVSFPLTNTFMELSLSPDSSVYS